MRGVAGTGLQNYDAALDIYSSLIERALASDAASPPSTVLMALYSNRAVAHLALQHYDDVIAECTQALTMLLGETSIPLA